MTFFRNPITTGVTLTSSYANPIVNVTTISDVGNTGAEAALYADSTTGWNVSNFGVIAGYHSYGVCLKGGGTVSNGAPGATAAGISGNSAGIYLSSGTVANFGSVLAGAVGVSLHGAGVIRNGSADSTTATILGSTEGIVLTAGGTITNFGTITSPGTYGQGIDFGNGRIINGAADSTTASIEGTASGITSQTATIANFGTITASGTAGNGVLVGNSTLANGSAGSTVALISGARAGISGNLVTVTNFGTILGTGPAGDGVGGADGTVTNGSAASTQALISGFYNGIRFNTAAVTNFGTIQGTSDGADAVYLVNGKVTNGSAASESALISGGLIGIEQKEPGAAVGNFGTIAGAFAGVFLDNGGSVTNGGSSDDAATIGNGLVGVYAFTATTVTNFGTIAGYDFAVSLGAGNDRLIVEPGAVFKGAVSGGGGGDSVTLAGAGTQHIGNFSGFETFTLSGPGSNRLVLANANFAGVTGDAITVTGGSAADTIDASHVTGSNLAILKGGAGNDTLIAGADTRMIGGSGANVFVFTATGSSRVTDFAAGNGNTIELRDADFNLGIDDGHGKKSPQHLDAAVFVADKTGAFTTTGQRFAYATGTGVLSYDADGSGTHFAASTVATLTGDPALSAGPAGNLFFVS